MSKAQNETKAQDEAHDLNPEAAPSEETLHALQAVDRPDAGALVPGEVSGEIGSSDVKLPVFKIIQKMSENPGKLDLGTMTVNGDTVVEDDGETTVTIVSIQKYYQEVLPYGAGQPRRFNQLADAIKEGFRLCRGKADRDSGLPMVEEAALLTMACHKPEGLTDRSFPFEFDGQRVLPAAWYLQSYAYGNIAKTVFTKLAFELRGSDLLEARWRITTERRKNSYGEFAVPHIQLLPDTNSKEFAEGLRKQATFV